MAFQQFRLRRTEFVLVTVLTLVAAAAGVWSEVVAQQARDDALIAEGAIVEAHWVGFGASASRLDLWTAQNVQRPGVGAEDWVAFSGRRIRWTNPPSIAALSTLEPLDEGSLRVGDDSLELRATVGAQFDEWNSTDNWRTRAVTAELDLLLPFVEEPSPLTDRWRSRHRALTGDQWAATFEGSNWRSRPPTAGISFTLDETQQEFLPAGTQAKWHRAGLGTGTFTERTR